MKALPVYDLCFAARSTSGAYARVAVFCIAAIGVAAGCVGRRTRTSRDRGSKAGAHGRLRPHYEKSWVMGSWAWIAEARAQRKGRRWVRALAFDRSGTRLAVAAGGDVTGVDLWGVQTMRLEKSLPEGDYIAARIQFSPDGRKLAVVSKGWHGRAVEVYGIPEGKILYTLGGEGPMDVVECAFSGDGHFVVAQGYWHGKGAVVLVADAESGRVVRKKEVSDLWPLKSAARGGYVYSIRSAAGGATVDKMTVPDLSRSTLFQMGNKPWNYVATREGLTLFALQDTRLLIADLSELRLRRRMLLVLREPLRGLLSGGAKSSAGYVWMQLERVRARGTPGGDLTPQQNLAAFPDRAWEIRVVSISDREVRDRSVYVPMRSIEAFALSPDGRYAAFALLGGELIRMSIQRFFRREGGEGRTIHDTVLRNRMIRRR